MSTLRPVAVPNLPLAGQQFTSQYQDQLNNVLRLYFTRLGGNVNNLVGTLGGQYLEFPYGSFSQRGDNTIATTNTPTLAALSHTESAAGMSLVVGDGIHVAQSGWYNYQFSIQFINAAAQEQDAFVWLRVNGDDVEWTASQATIPKPHGGVDGAVIMAANFMISMNAGDYVEMWWAADSTGVKMDSIPAISSPYVRPGSPALVVTMAFVSAIPQT